jgi:hypothetical protein
MITEALEIFKALDPDQQAEILNLLTELSLQIA